ncbi:MAG TPA: tRNA preQ1(34) S-adenosylmethionine ribosyltransferase-isomerase QueA [Acidimicrobiales bacterium]|nr:tRNA preQ1(34) S-adenosylmethionine ribosyltransferase-isomerase QueA [Acidimicrobiales bacterium]
MEPSQPTDAYDYDLPAGRIAQVPVEPRDSARLLVALDPAGAVDHRHVSDLPELLGPGDLLVVNETRVNPARLHLEKDTGGQVEVLLLEPVRGGCWQALVRPSRRVPVGTVLHAGGRPALEAGPVFDSGDGRRLVTILDQDAVDGAGEVALPPYVHEALADPERYQTVYARSPGSVAAPTAGLHLTPELLARCQAAGAGLARVDLAVGLGTFRPITSDRVEDHRMHSERYSVSAETLDRCRDARRVVAVGTTTVRALESAAATGRPTGQTDLFIRPGFPFRVVDVLLTNFHLPRSSLLVMLAAFCGARWRELYDRALEQGYRFLSFGDAMLVARSPDAGP